MNNVLILGGTGFVGTNLTKMMKENTAYNVHSIGSKYANLMDIQQVKLLYQQLKPNIIINLAGVVGGIGANNKYAGDFIYKNLIINTNAIHEASKLKNLKKFVQIGTVCSYGDQPPVPFKEEYLFTEYPSETNSYYGMAKLVTLPMLWAYRKQYNFNGIYLIPTNLYGEHDHFGTENNHVIPAIITKISKAISFKHSYVKLWGTGECSREFLYVGDLCRAIIMAIEKYDSKEPLNIGSGQEITIRELADLIAQLMKYDGHIIFDDSKPDGQRRRCVDSTRAHNALNWKATTNLVEGLQRTINYYQEIY